MPADRAHPAACARCGRVRPRHARGLCRACYQHLWAWQRAALARYPAARAAAVPPGDRRLLAGLRALLAKGGPGAAQLRALLAEAGAAGVLEGCAE